MEVCTSSDPVRAQKDHLNDWAYSLYGGSPSTVLSKEMFLQSAYDAICAVVRYNKGYSLIQAAVREHPDLIPRGFTILTVLHGAFTVEPTVLAVVRDFIAMLGDDLIDKELNVCLYARTKKIGAFFPELVVTLDMIREIYDSEHYSLGVLSPTSHQAYALFVLNRWQLLGKDLSTDELFGHLSVCHSMANKANQLASQRS